MILLDTHVWRWWVGGSPQITQRHKAAIAAAGPNGLGVSVISCWEVAKAVECGTLMLSEPVDKWMDDAVRFLDVVLLPLTPRIAVESAQLPRPFHRDPGDQIIVATSRVLGLPLLTEDAKILAYPHVVQVP
jgi:PIN domain nuclease of toxin-antitoxin system